MNTKRRLRLVGIMAVSTFAAAARSGLAVDVVDRASGSSAVRGEVTEITKTRIVVQVRTGQEIEIPVNDIVRIRWDGEKPSINQVRSLERSGRLQPALEGYAEELKQADPSNRNLKTDLEFLIARTTAKLAMADSSRLDQAVELLEAFRSRNSNHFRYYETLSYLGRLYLANKDFSQAQDTFRELADAPWKEYRMTAQISGARLLLEQDDVAGALAAYDEVIAEQPGNPVEMARRYEAMLGKASCLKSQQKYAQAIQLLQEVKEEASVDDTALLAETYVRQGDCLQAAGKTTEALFAYLHVDLLFPQENSLHAEALYHLAELWRRNGRPERAADAAARLQENYGKSEWAEKLSGAQAE